MNTLLDSRLAKAYSSASQKIRVMSEDWVARSVFCPNCGGNSVTQHPNNRPVADFFCSACNEDYELKSKGAPLGSKIVDGSYGKMIERIQSLYGPNFLFLTYQPGSLAVSNLLVIPKHFFTTKIIEKRPPLGPMARRAGWVGCNILLKNIPESGKIFYIKEGKQTPRDTVCKRWQKTVFLRSSMTLEARGWTLDIMRCIERLGRSQFMLSDIYAFENELRERHPANAHIKDKIRQQLQLLRDKEYLEFTSRGSYRIS